MISVIIPCYNQGAYIQEAIESVKAQTFSDWEIIIVDDGSDDDKTISTLKAIKEEKTTIYFQKNLGVSAARNIGAKHSRGNFILFLDGDDRIAVYYLETAMKALSSNFDLSYVYGDIQEFGDSNIYRDLEQLDIRKTLIHNQTHVSGIMRKSLWIESKGFDPSFRKGWEDWDFMIRILMNGLKYYKIPKVVLFYRKRNLSRDKTAVQSHEEHLLLQIYLKHLEIYLKYFPTPVSLLRNDIKHKLEIEHLNQKVTDLYKTYFYRIGSFLLIPFKILNKKFSNLK